MILTDFLLPGSRTALLIRIRIRGSNIMRIPDSHHFSKPMGFYRSVDIPETGDSDGDDAMVPVLEPEQQTFLSR